MNSDSFKKAGSGTKRHGGDVGVKNGYNLIVGVIYPYASKFFYSIHKSTSISIT